MHLLLLPGNTLLNGVTASFCFYTTFCPLFIVLLATISSNKRRTILILKPKTAKSLLSLYIAHLAVCRTTAVMPASKYDREQCLKNQDRIRDLPNKGKPYPGDGYRYLCFIKGCAFTTTYKSEQSRHFMERQHPPSQYQNGKVFRVTIADWLRGTYSYRLGVR